MTSSPVPKTATAIIARIGLGARALVYLAVATLLLDAATSAKPDNGVSPGDAFRAIETDITGRIVLIGLAVGLFLYALWRFHQAWFDPDHQGSDAKGILARMGMASSGISYFLVGIAAFSVTLGANESDGGGKTEKTAKWLMEQPFGRWMVFAAGLALIAIGGAQIWRTQSDQWKKGIDLSGWAQKTVPLIQFGIAGRGVLFALVGGFLCFAGFMAQPEHIRGLAATLGWIRYQPFGLWLFIASAIAIGAYGVYSGVQSLRYRFPDS